MLILPAPPFHPPHSLVIPKDVCVCVFIIFCRVKVTFCVNKLSDRDNLTEASYTSRLPEAVPTSAATASNMTIEHNVRRGTLVSSLLGERGDTKGVRSRQVRRVGVGNNLHEAKGEAHNRCCVSYSRAWRGAKEE
jgi:hypothetical protein